MGFMRRRAGQSVLAAVIGASFLVGGVANAAGLIPGPDGVIHGCYRQDGRLRVITATEMCDRNETALPWNQQGPKGDKGDPGAAGPPHVVVRTGGAMVASGAAASATAQCQPGEIATGGGAQIGSGGTGGSGGLGGNGGNAANVGLNSGFGNTGVGNTGAGNSGFANGGAAGIASNGAAYLTGSVPNATQGPATGWTGTAINLSGADQSLSVWAMCAS